MLCEYSANNGAKKKEKVKIMRKKVAIFVLNNKVTKI